MDRDLRRSAYLSGFVHIALIIAAIVTLPIQPLATSSDQDVEVDIIGLPPKQSNINGPGTATAVAPVVHQTDAKSQNAPKPKPIEAPPPPPPPPPPSKAPVSTVQTPQTAPPPPPKPSDVPSTLPPPPPVPPQQHPSTTPETVKPLAKPPTSLKSATHQQHDVKAPQVMSPAQLAQLLNSHAIKKQVQPPTHQYNPDQDTSQDVGGSTNSTANAGLSGPDREAIAAHMLPCWNYDGEAQNVGNFQVLLTVTTDASGTVRNAVVSPQNNGPTGNPLYDAFVNRALYAVQAYQCANLGPYLPSNLLGQNETFTFLYQPGQ